MDNPVELATLGTQDEGRTTQYEKKYVFEGQSEGIRIFRGRQSLDDQRPVDGFPMMPPTSACPVCNVYECFANDCASLRTLMHFISANMPRRYSASIRDLANGIRIITEQMGCSAARSSLVGNRWRHKENNYRIAKDTVIFLMTLVNRYRG